MLLSNRCHCKTVQCCELMNSVYYSGMQGHLQEGKQRRKTENIKTGGISF